MMPKPSMRRARKQQIAIFIVLAVTTSAAAFFAGCKRVKPLKTRWVMINLLPASVDVPDQVGYSHQFSIPVDATNARIEGQFTVEPRPQGQLQLLIVSTDGMQHWQKFLSSPAAHNDPGDAGLIYRSGETIADRFLLKMPPGAFYVIFDYGPATVGTTDHFGGGITGPAYRQARSQLRLSYDLPCETCP